MDYQSSSPSALAGLPEFTASLCWDWMTVSMN